VDFSPYNLLSGFVFSLIGWLVFRAGKRQSNISWVVSGILLMSYSMFTPSAMWTTGVGIALTGLAYRFQD
jgi:hypothetical protein